MARVPGLLVPVLCSGFLLLSYAHFAQPAGVSAMLGYDFGTRALSASAQTWKTIEPDYYQECLEPIWDANYDVWFCNMYAMLIYEVRAVARLKDGAVQDHWARQDTNFNNASVATQVNLPAGVYVPVNGMWTMSTTHSVVVSYYLCTLAHHPPPPEPDQYYCNYFGDEAFPMAWGNYELCVGEPAHIRRQYQPSPVGAYPAPGVTDVPACTAFATSGSSTYFTWNELTTGNGNPSHPWAAVVPGLWTALDAVRVDLGFAIHVNSGYRTPEGNIAVNSQAQQSRHQSGDAADIRGESRPPWSYAEWDMFRESALSNGFEYTSAFADYPSHIHVDLHPR